MQFLNTTRKLGPAAILAMALAAPGPARAAADTSGVDELRKRIDQLEAEREASDMKIATLENELTEVRRANGDDWLTEARAEEIRQVVQDVLADADTRASLLSSGMQAGWDKNFFIASPDGNFRLQIKGQIQVRYVFNRRRDSMDDDYRWGFEIRRAKLQLSGHVIDPTWTWALNLASNRRGEETNGDIEVEDALVTKEIDGWFFTAGQFKMPFNYEEYVSSSRQQAVDRTMVNEVFNLDRSVGVQIAALGDWYAVRAMYGNGAGERIGPAENYDTEFSGSIRGELFFGNGEKAARSAFKDYEGWEGQELAFMIGAGGYYEIQEFGESDPDPKERTWAATVDAALKGSGWSVAAAFYFRNLDTTSQDQWGVTVQGGFFVIPDELELFARYQYGDADSPGEADLQFVRIGANYFIRKHSLKWTNDLGFGINPIGDTWATTGLGTLEDAPGEDGQIVFRSQLQLLF